MQPGAFLPQCVDFVFQIRPREAIGHLAEMVARKKREIISSLHTRELSQLQSNGALDFTSLPACLAGL
jgi:hypothetical protein